MGTKKWLEPWKIVAAILVSFVCSIISSQALANSVSNFQQQGEGADAWWAQQMDSCTTNYAYVYGASFVTPSGGNSISFVYVGINTYNSCNGSYSYAEGYTQDSTLFSFSGQNTANTTLSGTIPVSGCSYDTTNYSYTCGSHSLAVNVNWAGNKNNATRSSFISRNQNPDGMFMYRYAGSQAPATASGSITEDNNLILINGNTPYGYIFNSTSGSISISHP